MRYFINGAAFTRQAAQKGVIPLKAGFRALFLKESAGRLLDRAGEWMDFESVAQGASDELRRDLEDGLTLLECFDIAQVEREIPPQVCRVAGERDYRRISAFLQKHAGAPENPSIEYVEALHNEDAVRARQFNNQEYHFLCERDGEIIALMIVRTPTPEDVSSVAFIQQAVFDVALPEDERATLLAAMIGKVASAFRRDYRKLRYLYFAPCQDRTLAELRQQGFEKVCTLEKELPGGAALHLYDKPIRR